MRIGAMNDPWNDLEKEILWISGAGFQFIDLAVEPPRGVLSHTMRIKELLQEKDLDVISRDFELSCSITVEIPKEKAAAFLERCERIENLKISEE